jgi:hypothetical protein
MDSVDEPPHDLCLRTWWVRKSGHRWVHFRERRGLAISPEPQAGIVNDYQGRALLQFRSSGEVAAIAIQTIQNTTTKPIAARA